MHLCGERCFLLLLLLLLFFSPSVMLGLLVSLDAMHQFFRCDRIDCSHIFRV